MYMYKYEYKYIYIYIRVNELYFVFSFIDAFNQLCNCYLSQMTVN